MLGVIRFSASSLSNWIEPTRLCSDEAENLITPSIYKEANKQRQDEDRTGHHIHKDRACGEVMAEAELFFVPYVHDNGLLEAVKYREVEKLTKLAAIYTLGCSPSAKV